MIINRLLITPLLENGSEDFTLSSSLYPVDIEDNPFVSNYNP